MNIRICTARRDVIQMKLKKGQPIDPMFFEVEIDMRSGMYVRKGDLPVIGKLSGEVWVHPDDEWKLAGVFEDSAVLGFIERVKEWWHGRR